MTTTDLTDALRARPRTGVILFLVALSFILPNIPLLNLISLPIQSFTTTIHEMGHAIACLMTGGSVAGMSIISDGEGHGGLTFCQGGIPFIYSQAGYITTALVGCALIWFGRYPKLSRYVLVGIGFTFAIASATFMFGTILQGQVAAGLGSMLVSLSLGCTIIWLALKATPYWANVLLLFLGVQTGLNALNDDAILIFQAFGGMPGTWSDASNMAKLTGIAPEVWAALWTIMAVGMIGGTLWYSYKLDKKRY